MEFNYLAIILATFAAFFLGFFWYSVIFAKPWQELIGMDNKGTGMESTKETPNFGRLLIISFIINFIMAFVLSLIIGTNGTWFSGLVTGFIIGFGFISLSIGANYMFAGRPLKLWLIDAGHYTVVFSLSGLIIGAL